MSCVEEVRTGKNSSLARLLISAFLYVFGTATFCVSSLCFWQTGIITPFTLGSQSISLCLAALEALGLQTFFRGQWTSSSSELDNACASFSLPPISSLHHILLISRSRNFLALWTTKSFLPTVWCPSCANPVQAEVPIIQVPYSCCCCWLASRCPLANAVASSSVTKIVHGLVSSHFFIQS